MLKHLLAHFQKKFRTKVIADASPVRFGAVLVQFQDGKGHQGTIKTKRLISTKVWLSGFDASVERKCRPCHGCQLVSQPVGPTPSASYVYKISRTTVDRSGSTPSRTTSGDNILVVVDYHSG